MEDEFGKKVQVCPHCWHVSRTEDGVVKQHYLRIVRNAGSRKSPVPREAFSVTTPYPGTGERSTLVLSEWRSLKVAMRMSSAAARGAVATVSK